MMEVLLLILDEYMLLHIFLIISLKLEALYVLQCGILKEQSL